LFIAIYYVPLYLFEVALATTERELADITYSTDDLFDLLAISVKKKIQLVNQYPHLSKFMVSAYYENEPIILKELSLFKNNLIQDHKNSLLSRVNKEKFKDPESISTLYDILIYLSEGYMARNKEITSLNIVTIQTEAETMFDVLKKNFYR